MTLDLLICHLPGRAAFLKRLTDILEPQLTPEVRLLVDDSRAKSVGQKRNDLLHRAEAKYVAFIDDDDRVSPDYVDLLLTGARQDVDCCSLTGEITENGGHPRPFIHSIKYDSYFEAGGVYYRHPNHLNCIRAAIATRFSFPPVNLGEDTDFARQMLRAGVLQTEYEITRTIYHYEYRSVK